MSLTNSLNTEILPREIIHSPEFQDLASQAIETLKSLLTDETLPPSERASLAVKVLALQGSEPSTKLKDSDSDAVITELEQPEKRGLKAVFDDDWKTWIWTNISRGCSKESIFKELSGNGFDHDAIRQELNYVASDCTEPATTDTLLTKPVPFREDEHQPDTNAETQVQVYFPNAQQINTKLAEIYVVDNFLSEEECQKLIDLIKRELRPSTITNPDEKDSAFRTSRTCDLSSIDDPFVKEIDERLCQYMGINPTYSEGIQGQHYEVGQEFKAHTDYFETNELQTFGAQQGQRTWTFMLYLNNTTDGGETVFHQLNTAFKPVTGRGLIWNSLYSDGTPNPGTLHQARPVQAGEKTVITKWFRAKGQGQQHTKTENETIVPLTAKGFKRCPIPAPLFKKLSAYLVEKSSMASNEVVKGFISGKGNVASELIELPEALRHEAHRLIQPILEEWSGIALEPTYVYGIRRYRRGASLKLHRDRFETHVVSATVNIFQDVDEDWPLEIEDHFYRCHQIVQAPGEMILYEGARLRHGRPTPLKGDAYASIFVHYKPSENVSVT